MKYFYTHKYFLHKPDDEGDAVLPGPPPGQLGGGGLGPAHLVHRVDIIDIQ